MNVTIPKVTVNGQSNAALNETVSTESFASPKSDLFTSSPHPNQTMGEVYERDTNIVNVSSQNSHFKSILICPEDENSI